MILLVPQEEAAVRAFCDTAGHPRKLHRILILGDPNPDFLGYIWVAPSCMGRTDKIQIGELWNSMKW